MKALSLWQPYASLVFFAGKHETRSWPKGYRGDMLVCSTAKRDEKERAPIPAKGRQGLWNPSPELEALVLDQLRGAVTT